MSTPDNAPPDTDTADVIAAEIDDPTAEVAAPEFPVVLRGYDRLAVDAYVERVTHLVEELYAMRSPRAAVGKALERVGAETAAILQRAHETADELTAASRARAEERRLEGEREAEALTADARESVKRLDADTEELWRERQRLLEDTRRIGVSLIAAVDDAADRFPAEEEPNPTEVLETPFNAEVEAAPEAEAELEPEPEPEPEPQPER